LEPSQDGGEVGRQGVNDVDGGPRHRVRELQPVRVQEGAREAELAGQGISGLAVDRIADDRVADVGEVLGAPATFKLVLNRAASYTRDLGLTSPTLLLILKSSTGPS